MTPFFLDIVDDSGTVESVEVPRSLKIKETVIATPVESARHLLIEPESWGWEELRDYVLHQAEERFGRQRRDLVKEKAIFQSFVGRWGDNASAIAKYAFEIKQGVWQRAPITVNRFCKGSDPFFAQVIAEHLGVVNSPS